MNYIVWDCKNKGYVSEINNDTDAYNVCDDKAQAMTFEFDAAMRLSNILFISHDSPFEVRTYEQT
jgi:hypothetical protein